MTARRIFNIGTYSETRLTEYGAPGYHCTYMVRGRSQTIREKAFFPLTRAGEYAHSRFVETYRDHCASARLAANARINPMEA